MAATMPDLGRSEDRRSLESGQGQTPATRADGPSACPGDSSHERGRVGASDNPWDMQQAAKSTRVRNAGEDLLPRPGSAQRSSALGWTTARVPRKRRAGCPHANPCGRRGRVKRGETPCRSARPYGGGRNRKTGEPWGRTTHGAMTCVWETEPRAHASTLTLRRPAKQAVSKGEAIGERSDAVLRTATGERSDAVLRTAMEQAAMYGPHPSRRHAFALTGCGAAPQDEGRGWIAWLFDN